VLRPLKMRYLAIVAVGISGLLTCSVATHEKRFQQGCDHILHDPGTSLTADMVRHFYGEMRRPDEVLTLPNGSVRLVYYAALGPGTSSRHWSGYVVYFLWFPVLPLLYPDGHHQNSYLIVNGLVGA